MTSRAVNPPHHQQLRQRDGEGVPLRVNTSRVQLPDGSTAVATAISLTSAPVPSRRYYARVASILHEDSRTVIALGQPKIGGTVDALRSLVLVNLSAEGLRYLLDICKDFLPALRTIASQEGWPTQALQPIREEPAQTVSLVANLVLIARAGSEAILDFYHASASSFHVASTGSSDLGVDPVVRIDLSAPLLLSILNGLESPSEARKP